MSERWLRAELSVAGRMIFLLSLPLRRTPAFDARSSAQCDIESGKINAEALSASAQHFGSETILVQQ